jgi:hypothetical protein
MTGALACGGQVGLTRLTTFDDHVQRVCERLVPQAGLGDAGLAVSCSGGLLARRRWQRGVSALAAIRAMRTATGSGTGSGAGPRRSAPQLGKQRQVALPRHMPGVVVAAVTVPPHVGQGETPGAQLQQGLAPAWATHDLRRAGHVRWGGVLAALRTPWTVLGGGGCRLRGVRVGLAGRLLRFAAHDLLDAERERAPWLGADPGPQAAGQPWHRRAVHARDETIQALGLLASVGEHACVARPQVDIRRTVHLLTEERPQAQRPWEHRGETALDGARAAPFAGPARNAPHGDASGHAPPGERDPTALAEGRRRHTGSEALETCDNVPAGFPVA